jgi:thiaminase
MANTSSWTRQAWDAALPIFNQILDHPFIKELAAGTLAPDKFDRYLAQDELYVGNYGRQMFELAELIPDPVQHDMFYAFAKEGIEGEKAMHALLIDRFGIDTQVQPSQVTAVYNAHTEAAIRRSFHENLKDTTVIIIAQRISSVQSADRIFILDDDRIAGVGTHDELLATNAIYQEIYNSQQEGVIQG